MGSKLSMKELICCNDRELWNKLKMISAIFNPRQAAIMKAMERFKKFD